MQRYLCQIPAVSPCFRDKPDNRKHRRGCSWLLHVTKGAQGRARIIHHAGCSLTRVILQFLQARLVGCCIAKTTEVASSPARPSFCSVCFSPSFVTSFRLDGLHFDRMAFPELFASSFAFFLGLSVPTPGFFLMSVTTTTTPGGGSGVPPRGGVPPAPLGGSRSDPPGCFKRSLCHTRLKFLYSLCQPESWEDICVCLLLNLSRPKQHRDVSETKIKTKVWGGSMAVSWDFLVFSQIPPFSG